MTLALACRSILAGALAAAAAACSDPAPDAFMGPELVTLPAGSVIFRPAGEYLKAGMPIDPPLVTVRFAQRVSIMKRQVTAAEYRRCVAEGACPATAGEAAQPEDHPVVNASWRDARAYAAWLSAKAGQRYRLPTEAEWAYAAAERFHDDALPVGADAGRAERTIARYEQETQRAPGERQTRPAGGFGANSRGILDLASNVWEWTETCFERVTLGADGAPAHAPVRNCGIRVLEGPHRAYVADFIRDARSGGCAAGIPPVHMGFRLVLDRVAPGS
jgi:formylglycine-generating enzyme required for sulfatase activity